MLDIECISPRLTLLAYRISRLGKPRLDIFPRKPCYSLQNTCCSRLLFWPCQAQSKWWKRMLL